MPIHAIGQRTVLSSVLSLLACGGAFAQPPGRGRPPGPPDGPPPPAGMPMQIDALRAIERAYDGVNRAASFAAVSKEAAGVSLITVVTQSKNAYQEALSRYQASDLIGARELATVASDLSHAIEELVMNGATRASAQLPAPPTPTGFNDEAFRANDELARAGQTTIEAQTSLTSYSNLIAADAAAQARTLIATSQQLQERGHALLTQNQPREASAMARAADALAHAASHLQNRYLIAAGVVAPEPPGPPPPGPGWGRGRGRGPGG